METYNVFHSPPKLVLSYQCGKMEDITRYDKQSSAQILLYNDIMSVNHSKKTCCLS